MTLKNNLYNIFGGGGRALLFLVTIPLMVNFLGVERFGIWALITSVGNIALILDVGIASTTMHYISELKIIKDKDLRSDKTSKSIPILFILNLFFSLILFVGFLFYTEAIANIFLTKKLITNEIIISLRWVGLYSAIILMQHFFSGILQAYNKFLLVNIIKFSNILIINFGLLSLSYLGRSFTEFTFYMFVVSLFTLIFYMFLASKKLNIFKIKFLFDLEKAKDILLYSATTWVGYLGTVLFTQFDKIIIGKVTTPEVLGIYAAIISIISYISSIATVGLQPIIPKLTELWSLFNEKKEEFIFEFKHAHQFNALLIFVSSLGLLITHKVILNNVMDIDLNKYPQAGLAFKLAILIYALNALSVPGFYSLMAIKKTKYISVWQTLGAALALSSIYVLGKEFGLMGVIIGNLGLIITWRFNFISSKISLKNRYIWFHYIYKPLVMFVGVCIIFINLNNMYINIFISIISIILLTRWYLLANPETLNLIKRFIKK